MGCTAKQNFTRKLKIFLSLFFFYFKVLITKELNRPNAGSWSLQYLKTFATSFSKHTVRISLLSNACCNTFCYRISSLSVILFCQRNQVPSYHNHHDFTYIYIVYTADTQLFLRNQNILPLSRVNTIRKYLQLSNKIGCGFDSNLQKKLSKLVQLGRHNKKLVNL